MTFHQAIIGKHECYKVTAIYIAVILKDEIGEIAKRLKLFIHERHDSWKERNDNVTMTNR